jgi:hypothetical protein
VPLDAVIESVRPALNATGFTLSQWRIGKGLTTLILHESGQYIFGEAEMVLETMTPQAVGSATTYERRCGALGATGTSGDVDDDAELAHDREPDAKKAPPTKKEASKPPPKEGRAFDPDELEQLSRFVTMIGESTKLSALSAVAVLMRNSPLHEDLKVDLRHIYADKLHELERTKT